MRGHHQWSIECLDQETEEFGITGDNKRRKISRFVKCGRDILQDREILNAAVEQLREVRVRSLFNCASAEPQL
jgi:hypothetical protein